MAWRACRYGCFSLLLVLFAGCAAEQDPWPRAAVQGQVTLDGKPLESGQVTFFPTGSTRGPAAGAELNGGQFRLARSDGPVVGTNRVEIRSVQPTGRIVESPQAVEGDGQATERQQVQEFLDVVPTRYNTYSELEVEIRADGNDLEFRLTTQQEASPKKDT